jgi:hypothetical protein
MHRNFRFQRPARAIVFRLCRGPSRVNHLGTVVSAGGAGSFQARGGWLRWLGGGGTMGEIWDVVLGVVGCFAIFGVFSLVKRLIADVFSFATRPSGARATEAKMDFENEHPMTGGGQ